MFHKMFNRATSYFSRHVMLCSAAHTAGGFGLAIVLQQYYEGGAFIDVRIGWVLIAFSVLAHLRAITK